MQVSFHKKFVLGNNYSFTPKYIYTSSVLPWIKKNHLLIATNIVCIKFTSFC